MAERTSRSRLQRESARMQPEKAIFQTCDPSKHAILEQSFQLAWNIVRPKQIEPGCSRELELRLELARCFEKLSSRNFKDADEMTKRCVEEFLLSGRV